MNTAGFKASADEGKVRGILRTPLTSLINFMGLIGSWFFVVVALIIVTEVVLRNFFGLPQIWTEETSGLLTIIGAYFMFTYTLQEKGHIPVDFISAHLSKRSTFILEIFTTCLSAIFCAILVWYGVKMVISSRIMGEATQVLLLPKWTFQSCWPMA